MSKNNNPLVSIIVITYNSSKYVLETLESAYNQTYKNIELIITDDCSTDDTVEVCKNWVAEHKDRFVRTEVITSSVNTGIPKNCNRGLYAAKGEWVKLIAGDDALFDTCVIDNIEFVKTDSDIKFVFSDYEVYAEILDENFLLDKRNDNIIKQKFSNLNCETQLKVIVRGVMISGTTTFINRESLIDVGGYDEKYRFIEDWTTWYRWIKADNKIYYLPMKTVKYRRNSTSITRKNLSTLHNQQRRVKGVFIDYYLKYFSFTEKVLFYVEYAYYDFYKKSTKMNFFQKTQRRIWYFFVELSIEMRKKNATKLILK